tara:strand:+ start:18389 stop:20353 length:1965 start_codon:yes stop_codon:yes gene_type:complete
MASSLLNPELDEHHFAAPLSVTTALPTQTHAHAHHEPAHASCPASPTATTLAALADSRPATALEDDDDFEDDGDYSGGISITSADLLDYTSAGSLTDTHMAEEEVAEQLQSAMAQFHAFPHTGSTAFDPFEPLPSYHMPSIHMPTIFSGHMSSSDPSLEPPPTLQEAHLSIQDKGSFAPITSFFHYLTPEKPTVPGLDLIHVPDSITRDDLQGDRYDAQGIDWVVRNTTRSHVRSKRFECESAKLPRSLQEVRAVGIIPESSLTSTHGLQFIPPTPNTDSFYRFRRNNTTHRAFFPHFQLRNVLTATSRNDIYYAAGHRVFRTDAEGSSSDVMIDLSKRLTPDGSITTIASTDNVLIAGAFDGEYAITNLTSEYGTPCTFGRTSDFSLDTKSRIVNHMHLFESRTTYHPQAVLCSNDHRLRVLDCVTDKFLHSFLYPAAVNCAATSPNGRMRVVVGDFQETLITNAETGQAFETLNSHTDDAFACAWADDGFYVATAAQDSTIAVWDARYWERPLTILTSELSIPRSLRFSPVGSGPRVLVAAEADDYISIINAQTWESKQVFDFFGPIGGTAFTPDGQSLFIANGERRFGGIIELDRTGWAENNAKGRSFDGAEWVDTMTDWAYDDWLSNHDRVPGGDVNRSRRCVNLDNVVV